MLPSLRKCKVMRLNTRLKVTSVDRYILQIDQLGSVTCQLLWSPMLHPFSGLDIFQYSAAMQADRPRYVIDRPAYNLPDFDREFDKKNRQFPLGEKVKKLFRYRITISPHSQHELHVSLTHKTLPLTRSVLWSNGGEPCSYDSIQSWGACCGLFSK